VPVIQDHQVNVEAKEINPVQGFFDNTQFPNVLDNVNFQNPFQNVFENFELPSFPSLPFLPSAFSPLHQESQSIAPAVDVSAPAATDSVTIDNPALKIKTSIAKTSITHPTITKTSHAQSTAKDSTCIGPCVIPASTEKKEYVQPTDANGGYIY